MLALVLTGCYSVYRAPVAGVHELELPLVLPSVEPKCIEMHLRGGHVLVQDGEQLGGKVLVSVVAEDAEQARTKASDVQLNVVETDGTCSLRITHPSGVPLDAVDVRYRLQVPPTMSVRVFALAAQVAVRGFGGEISVRTDSGQIRARPSGGSCALRTRTGNIRLEGAYREAALSSTSGRIEVTLPTGGEPVQLDAESGTGAVIIDMLEHRRMKLDFTTAGARLRTDFPVVWNTNGVESADGREFRGLLGSKEHPVTVEARVSCDAASFEVRPILHATIP